MYDDILIPTDGSDVTALTLDHGIRIAKDHDATVHALYVIDNRIIMAANREDRERLKETLEAEGDSAVAMVADRAEPEGLPVRTSIRRGTPHREILEYVTEHGIDLITIGTQGKSPREKLQSMGSVTDRVVDRAPVPVLVIRNVDQT